MTHPERDAEYLHHILEAIRRIRAYTSGKDKHVFLTELLLQDAVIRNIEIIGEAANRLSAEFVRSHMTVPWPDIAGMRHRLIHGYMTVNLQIVWNVVERELPNLEKQIKEILKGEAG